MNHVIIAFDQESEAMFILKYNRNKGLTGDIAIIKELNKMAYYVQGAKTGFIATDSSAFKPL